jgi:GT2 family glycosyltransferase
VPQAAAGHGPRVRFYRQDPNLGFAGGHQFAYEKALSVDPEYVYLLNSDATVDAGIIREAVAYAAVHPQVALVQSMVMLEQEPWLMNASGNAMHFLGYGFSLGYRKTIGAPLDENGAMPMFYPSGAGVLVRVSVLKEIGGLFDPEYFLYHEDSDLGWRALISGRDVATAERSVMYHRYEFSKSKAKFYWIERNRVANLMIFYRIPTLILIAPVFLAMELGMLLFSVKNGWWREKFRAVGQYLRPSTWRWIARRRALVQRIRTRRDRDILDRMVGEIANQEVASPLLTHVVNPVTRAYFGMLKAIVRW